MRYWLRAPAAQSDCGRRTDTSPSPAHYRTGTDCISSSPAVRGSAAAQCIANSLPSNDVSNLVERLPLAELPSVISGASLYVGLDTGTTHVAAALRVPTVAIISGVPNLEVWHTVGPNVTVVAGRVPCSSCYLTHPEQCHFGVVCLSAITSNHVISACNALLLRQRQQDLVPPAG